MINGTTRIIILVLFIVVLLLGGTLMSYLSERIERKAERWKFVHKGTQESEKPKQTRRAA